MTDKPITPQPRLHRLKTDPEVYQAVLAGRKTFEICLNDRDFRVGDELLLMETTATGEAIRAGAPLQFTGNEMRKRVSHVLSGYGLMPDWVCLSFESDRARQAPAPVEKPTAREAADALLEAGEDFWAAVGREDYKSQGAVQWLTCDDGATVIFTRGEYKRTLLQNIDSLPGTTVLHFQDSDPDDEYFNSVSAFSRGSTASSAEWVLVPRAATEEMMTAMVDPFIAVNGDNRKAFTQAYENMLAAAPSAATSAPSVGVSDQERQQAIADVRALLYGLSEVPASFESREVLSELVAIDKAVEHWVEDKQPRSQLLRQITDNIRNLLASTASTPVGEVPAGWREILERAKDGLGAGGRSHSDQAFIDYGTALIDHIEEGIEALAASPAPAASKGAEAVTCERCGHENWIMEGKAPCQITAADKRAAPPEPEAQKAVALPDGHLHDDGYFTWAPHRLGMNVRQAGWRAPFYLASPSPAASMEVQGLTDAELRTAWEAGEETGYLEWAAVVTRALVAKNGWRLGEGQ